MYECMPQTLTSSKSGNISVLIEIKVAGFKAEVRFLIGIS